MKIDQLFEAIEAPLYTAGYQSVSEGIKTWLPEVMKILDQYTGKAQYRAQVKQQQSINPDDWDAYSRLRDDQYQREYEALVQEDNQGLHAYLVKTFKEMLENQLRQASMSYIEGMFGKREDYDNSESWDEIQKKNLYFLRYLIVDIDFTATYKKSGKPRTGGGYFQRFPQKGEFTDTYSQNLDWKNDVGFAIKVYTSENKLWLAAVGIVIEALHIEHFGEATEPNNGLENLLGDILPTWVHETVHMEQTTRRRAQGKNFYKHDWGMTYTPQIKKRPAVDKFNKELQITQKFKHGGKRGFPSHLEDIENTTMAEWIEYFGTAHEIEAHAAGAAADAVHSVMKNLQRYSSHRDATYFQSELNHGIDSIIQDLTYAYLPTEGHSSFNSYFDHIKGEAMRYLRLKQPQIDIRDQRVLNKINFGARKVWTIFLKKLTKHLLAYKKPVPDYSDRDPRLRTPMIRKPELPG